MQRKLLSLLLIFYGVLNAQQYQDNSGLVVMEAENLPLVSGWSTQTGVSGFTGSGYINNTDAEYFGTPGNNMISTQIQINKAGTYRVQWRTRIGSGSSFTDNNDTWLRFNDADEFFAATNTAGTTGIIYPNGSGQSPNPNGAGSANWFKIYMNTLNNWTWYTATSDNDPHWVFVTFDTPGIYTMEISARSLDHLIDRVVLYDSSHTEASATNTGNAETLFVGGGDENTDAAISGDLMRYHKVTLTWGGLFKTETPSTFRDNRLNVTFTSPTNKTYVVPGYFAADGGAGESGASSGSKWRCHFTPLETGTWTYSVSFRTGTDIAASTNPSDGTGTNIDGKTGSFTISETDKTGKDFRGKGKLEYVGEHFLKWSNGEYFLKLGANSPETFLEFQDFDGTPSSKTYSSHVPDWQAGDPVWQGTKGKGLIGVVNYLSSQDMNAHYFLTMNQHGDGEEAYPWTGLDQFYTYDVSKLDQWQIVFDHMMVKGLMTHFVTTEQENQSYFEIQESGTFANSRKIYYRELIARFGYLNAITWNIGEENGWAINGPSPYDQAVTDAQRIAFADYVDTLTPYNDNIVVHNGPAAEPVAQQIYNGLLNINDYTGISYQAEHQIASNGHDDVLHWIDQSRAISGGNKWVVSYDEPFAGNANLDTWRKNSLWAALTAGAAGVELFNFSIDLTLEDYRTLSTFWETMKRARDFFEDNSIPFQEMGNDDALVSSGWCLAKDSDTYVIYLSSGGTTTIDLPGTDDYTVRWYDPRKGGVLQTGTIGAVSPGSNLAIGNPPSSTSSDWVVLLQTTAVNPGSGSTVRINTAGALVNATDGESDWLANDITGASSFPEYSVNTGRNGGGTNMPTRHSSVPSYVDQTTFDAIYATERWDQDDGLEMEYTIPVGNGTYDVNLYMVNFTNHTSEVGERVFDIEIEGSVVQDNVDLIVEFGHQVGGTLTFPVTVTDGAVNIRFLHEVENPLVNAIEVRPVQPTTTRINTAGILVSATDGNSDWLANDTSGAFSNANYSVNTGNNASGTATITRHSSIPSYVDQATFDTLFTSERWDPSSSPEMEYTIPVVNGDYNVNLYMTNKTTHTSTVGTRVFDIEIEGTVVKDDLDLITEFGHRVGGMLSFPVTITDGAVNIRFLHEIENPLVYAIEVRVPEPTTVRINTAGALVNATDGESDWLANDITGASSFPEYSVNTGRNGGGTNMPTRHSSVPSYVDQTTFDAIYATERWDQDDGLEMEYTIPVGNGTYDVNLYMVNFTNHTSEVGERVFDIEIEGSVVQDNVDLIVEFGHQVGGTLTFPVTVTDGAVNIRFLHEVENPLVNAIELREASSQPPQTVELSPIHDAYLEGSTRRNTDEIRIQTSGPARVGYLMFDLSGISGTINSAELQFTIFDDDGNGLLHINEGNGTNWTETNLSGANKPGVGALLGTIDDTYLDNQTKTVVLNASEIETGLYSIIVTQINGTGSGPDLNFASKEHPTLPPAKLVVTYQPGQGTPLRAVTTDNLSEGHSDMIMFPNPTAYSVRFQGMEGEKQIRLMDISGRVILETSSSGSEPVLDMQKYPRGIYLVRVQSNAGAKIFKIVKQ